MKTINFSYTGGFPLDEQTLDKMQNSYTEMFKSILPFLGMAEVGNYIISGVNVTGTDISAGFVYMDGDIIAFPAMSGTAGLATTLKKIVSGQSLAFEDGQSHPVYIETSVGVDPTGVALSTFVRINPIVQIPQGIVIDPAFGAVPVQPSVVDRIATLEAMLTPIKSGKTPILFNDIVANIPNGYAEWTEAAGETLIGIDTRVLPNGQFKNPEFSQLGAEGGEKNHTLTIEQMPAHKHTQSRARGGGSGTQIIGYQGSSTDNYMTYENVDTSSEGGVPDGTTQAFSLLNPYRVVRYIVWVGI